MRNESLFYTMLSTLFLVFSYLIYVYFVFGIFVSLLIPYDVVFIENRPPVGSWARSVNDYFEGNKGDIWFLVTIVISSIVLIITLIRGRKLPMHKLLTYISIFNCFFGACFMFFGFIGSFFVVNNFNWLAVFGIFISLLLVWYFQATLFFVKTKIFESVSKKFL